MTGELVPPPPLRSGPRWHLSLLGGVRLHDATTVHTRFATRAITALLARLALWPQREHPREELIELLWPGVDASTGRRRLRQALSLLRAVLEPPQDNPVPVLQATRLSVRVVPGTIVCDVHTFEAQWKTGHRDAALSCYPGEFMPGFFDEWIHDERTRLNNLHERLAATQPQDATPRVKGTPPELQVPAASAQVRRSGLPGYLTRYFANDEQSERLLAQLLAHRLVTLLGPGGSGKTRLAVELAEQLGGPEQAAPFSTVLFVPLASAQTQEQLLGALQTALQISTPTPRLENIVARLEGVQALLVLDNAEQLVEVASAVIGPLTAALPQLHLLVTSRRALGLDGERCVQIEPLPVPPADASLQQAATSPAVVLFVDRACAVRVDFHLSARNHTAVVELVRALEGMPLAIELAASRIRAFSPAEMLARLRGPLPTPGATPGLDLLARPGTRSTQQARHASMQRTIEWSWQQLAPDLQALAAAMAVFPGGCDAAMLAGVQAGDDVAAGLEQLQAHSLIHARGDPAAPADPAAAEDAPRWQLYEPIREYAAAQFDAAHSARWRARQRAWALDWLQALPATPPLGRVRAELTNLCAAFSSAAADAAGSDAAKLLLALHPLQEGVTLPPETLAHARAALPSCSDAGLRSRGWSELAALMFTAGEPRVARELADLALECAPGPGTARSWAQAAKSYIHWRGLFSPADQVLPWIEQAQACAEQTGDTDLLASSLCLLSMLRYALDRDAEASRQLAARAQTLWERQGNRHGVNYARHNRAVYEFHGGQRELALSTWDAIAAEATVLQDTRRLAISNSARCAAFSEMRRWPQARQAMRESLQQSWRAMRLYELSYDLWNLPRVLAHLRQPKDAACLMAFAVQFWQQRFGQLTAADWRQVEQVERLVARQVDAGVRAAAAARGRQMQLAEAVAFALTR